MQDAIDEFTISGGMGKVNGSKEKAAKSEQFSGRLLTFPAPFYILHINNARRTAEKSRAAETIARLSAREVLDENKVLYVSLRGWVAKPCHR